MYVLRTDLSSIKRLSRRSIASLQMPPKKVCKRRTKTSTNNVEHADRKAGETGHKSDEGERDAQEEGDMEKTSCSFSTATEERLVEFFCSKPSVLRQDTAKLASMGLSYIHVYIYRNKRTLALRTHTYNVRASKNTIRELCV